MTTVSRSQRLTMRASTLGALMSLLVANGRWWLVPLVLVFGVTSVLLSVVAAIEYFAPFVYSLF